jgi:hypothetical protein
LALGFPYRIVGLKIRLVLYLIINKIKLDFIGRGFGVLGFWGLGFRV